MSVRKPIPNGQFGPVYNVTGVGAHRKRAMKAGGLAAMPREQVQAYGEAVLASVLAAQRRANSATITKKGM